MSPGPKIVHKQFNSPIGLYSQQNIQETLSKHVHQLNNGAVGIDFSDPTTSKPANLANSTVLRMLEEEERQRRGLPNKKKVVWPPAFETNGYHSGASPTQGQHSPLYYEGGAPALYESPAAPRHEPPPSTIELRAQQPVHQRPPPVFASQPAAASFQGGVNMRGDQKWPPPSVKEAVAAENLARVQLAKGPACRPRKVRKDYTGFFAQNALNNNYPGYRVPPGTQHYEDQSGQTSF